MKNKNKHNIRYIFESMGDIRFSLEWFSEIQRLKMSNKGSHTMEYLKYLEYYIRKLERGFHNEFVVNGDESIFEKKERLSNSLTTDYAKFTSKEWTTKYNIWYSEVDTLFYNINKSDKEKRAFFVDLINGMLNENIPKLNKKLIDYKPRLVTRLKGLTEEQNLNLTRIVLVYPKLVKDLILENQ